MTEPIEALRYLRNQTITFERCMSDLVVAIGNIERLSDLETDQIDRLRQASARLSAATPRETTQ